MGMRVCNVTRKMGTKITIISDMYSRGTKRVRGICIDEKRKIPLY